MFVRLRRSTAQKAVQRGGSVWQFIFAAALIAPALLAFTPVAADERSPSPSPLKVGFSVPLSGDEAQKGEQILIALQLWRDDVNARGGLLRRPVELVYHDDQNNPGKVPAIYRKLINDEKVDLILGPSTTNLSAAAMRVVMEFGKVEISILGIGVNRIFAYPKYFAMLPFGPDGAKAPSKELFHLAATQSPKPQTVALIATDSEFPNVVAEGAKDNATAAGFKIVYEKSHPLGTTDLVSTARELKAANPDMVLVSSAARGASDVLQAVINQGVVPKIFGLMNPGSVTRSVSEQLGRSLDGIVSSETFALARSLSFVGTADLLRRYHAAAVGKQLDPFDVSVVPFAYAAGQVLAQAVTETRETDSSRLADYIHNHTFDTVIGPIEYGQYGEWKEPRLFVTQYQRAAAQDVDPSAAPITKPIVWPPRYQTGDLIYPYARAR